LPPREIAKSFSANGMIGRGGGDRTHGIGAGLFETGSFRHGSLEFSSPVELFLLLGIVHFCVQIDLRYFERFVSEPVLDFH